MPGFFIQRESHDIADKLDRVLSDGNLQRQLREGGLATAGNYAWEKIAKQYLQLFKELMAERLQDSRSSGRLMVTEPNVSIQ